MTGNAEVAVAPRRFRAGVQIHEENFDTRTFTLGTSASGSFSIDVPAYGFLRGVWLRLDVAGFTGTAAVYKEDSPFSVITSLQFLDVNSAPIEFQITGHDLYVLNKYGGFGLATDAKAGPTYSAPTSGNFVFILRIPLEIRSRDGLGALANMNNATAYRITGTIGAQSDVYSTVPTGGTGVITMRCIMDAWWEPADKDLQGRSQTPTPPGLGTTQYVSKQVISHTGGSAVTHKLSRVGYYVRNLIFIQRDATPARSNTVWPDSATVVYEGQQMTVKDKDLWRHQMQQWFGYDGTANASKGLDTGVFLLPFNNDFGYQPGNELGNGYLPTTPATRLEIQGTAGGSGACSLSVLTNDVAARDDAAISA